MKLNVPSPGKFLFLTVCFFVTWSVQAQQSVSIGTTQVKNTAVLNLVSAGKNQALIVPVVSSLNAVSPAEAAMLVYNEADSKLYYRNASAWVEVGGGGGTITLGGDLTGTPATANIARLQGRTVSAANPSDGQILKYNSATQTWTLSSDAGASYTAGTGITITANQIAVANDGITTTQIAANTITNADLNKTSIPVSGFGAATAAVDLGNQKVTNLATPTANTDAATKAYVDAADATKLSNTILTTEGDILYRNGTTTVRLPRGTVGQVLQSTAAGIQWATTSGLTNPMTTIGDIIVGGASGAPTRLAGAAGFLKSTGAATPAWSSVNLASTDVAGTLPLTQGGTGATTAANARTNLGLGSLATLNNIVDANVDAAAAINGSKINPNFGTQNVVTTGRVGVGTTSPSTGLQVVDGSGSTTPMISVTQTNAGAGDAALNFSNTAHNYSVGLNNTGSFKISNSAALGTTDNIEITPADTDASGLPKVLMNVGGRGQDGVQISSTSAWGTSLHMSNGTGVGTASGYTMAVTGASGPTSHAGDFAIVYGLSSVMTIGYYSSIANYAVNFPQYVPIFGGNTPMRVGINMSATTAPNYNLEVTGTAGKTSGTAWVNTSDRRLKKDISAFTDGLNVITRINPVWFKYSGKGGIEASKESQVGVIAQEMKEIAPYTVGTFKAKYDDDSPLEDYYNFDYSAIGYAMINAVKELDQKVKVLEEENANLKRLVHERITLKQDSTQQSLQAALSAQQQRTDQLESELKEIKRILSLEAKKQP